MIDIPRIIVNDLNGQPVTYKLLSFPNQKYIENFKAQFENADPSHENYQELKEYILKFDKSQEISTKGPLGQSNLTTHKQQHQQQQQQLELHKQKIQQMELQQNQRLQQIDHIMNPQSNKNKRNDDIRRPNLNGIPLLDITITQCDQMSKEDDSSIFSNKIIKGKWNNHQIVLKEFNSNPDEAFEKLKKEFDTIYSVNHANLIRFYGKSSYGLVFEDPDEGSLEMILFESNIKIRLSIRLNWSLDVAKGMGYLHSESIVHGNLKISNCFLNSIGICKLGEYGLLNGRKEDDVYAFGRVLYELVTRRSMDTPLQHIPNSISPVLKLLIERCLDKSPLDRPSFQEIITIIESIIKNSQFLLLPITK